MMYKYVCVFANPHIKKFIVKMLSGEQERALTGDRKRERERPNHAPARGDRSLTMLMMMIMAWRDGTRVFLYLLIVVINQARVRAWARE